jgi:type IV pilus assembly protein PilA
MFQRFHEKLQEREGGFTLIELLVVILIIAILAAIAIPVFLAQRQKGWESQLESALKNSATSAESYLTGAGDGAYTGLTRAGLNAEGFKAAAEVNLEDADVTVNAAPGDRYCIEATHDRLGALTMGISSESTTPEEGTCAAGVFTPAAP